MSIKLYIRFTHVSQIYSFIDKNLYFLIFVLSKLELCLSFWWYYLSLNYMPEMIFLNFHAFDVCTFWGRVSKMTGSQKRKYFDHKWIKTRAIFFISSYKIELCLLLDHFFVFVIVTPNHPLKTFNVLLIHRNIWFLKTFVEKITKHKLKVFLN